MINPEHLPILEQGVQTWNNWRKDNPTIKPDLRGANLEQFKLSGADFTKADLREANLAQTVLVGANFEYAYLNQAILSGARAGGVFCGIEDTEPRVTNFTGADLSNVYFSYTDISHANLGRANLTNAYLIATQAIYSNFKEAIFTGACIDSWNINSETILENITCDYIYLKFGAENSERRPHNPNKNFELGEFTKLFQKALKTVDLIFSKGINWQAFLTSFQKLQIECGSSELAIQAIEKKYGGAFVIRVEVPPDANKVELEKYIKREYKLQLKAIEDKYRLELNAKDKEIEIYKEKSADLLELTKLLASRSINISQTQGNNMAGDRNIQMGGGNYNERIEGDYIQGNSYAVGEKRSLADVAAEIQTLLKQLEQSYPTKTTSDEMIIAAKAIEHIESNPTLKQRVISAAKEGSLAALEKAIDNPAGAFIVNAIKGWQEAK